jgi:hypothetical protein
MACAKPEETGPRLCGAKTRSGGTCKLAPLTGQTRCKLHGGATPSGKDSPHFKHGFYAKALPKDLKANFEKLLADPQLLEGRSEVALMQLRLQRLSARVNSNESGRAWRTLQDTFNLFREANDAGNQEGMLAALNRMNEIVAGEVNDENAWAELTDFIEKATKVAEREWKRILANRQVVTTEQVRLIVASLTQAVLLYVKEPEARQQIAEHVNRLRVIEPVQPTTADGNRGD